MTDSQQADSVINYKFLNDGTVHADLIFPHLVVKIHDFPTRGVDEVVDAHQTVLNKNKSNLQGVFAFVKSDTVNLRGYDFYHNIQLVAGNPGDKFKVSYCYKMIISGLDDNTRLIITPEYKTLKDSSTYFFRLPKPVSDYNDVDAITAIKNKLKLKDTIAKNSNGDEVGGFVSYKNKICRIDPDNNIYLKIERFDSVGKFLEKKFLKIELTVLEEAED